MALVLPVKIPPLKIILRITATQSERHIHFDQGLTLTTVHGCTFPSDFPLVTRATITVIRVPLILFLVIFLHLCLLQDGEIWFLHLCRF